MVQRVKVFRQVEDYRSRVSLPDILFYPEYGVFCPSPRSITKAVIREQRLLDWHELLEYRLLDDAIDNGRDTKLAYPSIRLRDLHPFDRRRGIFPLSDPFCQFVVMFLQPWQCRFDGHPIDSRRSLVCLYSLVSSVQIVLVQYLTS